MKKHILGFAIFSFIIASAVFLKFVFYVPESFDVPSPTVNRSCWKMNREFAKISVPMVRQAVLDLNTKQMNWELKMPDSRGSVALHFFVKNSQGARYLATEFVPYNSSENGIFEFTSSYLWLDKLGAYENLYVVPEQISRSEFRARNFEPDFNENAATSVLLYSGKAGYLTESYFRK